MSCSSPPPCIKELVCGLQYLTKTKFKISFEDVDTEGALALVSGLQLCNFFYPLELHLINTSNVHAHEIRLPRCLRGFDKPNLLRSLSVSHNTIGFELFNILCNGLLNCTSLSILDLSCNDISAGDTKPLASLLQSHKGLVRLDLCHNNLEMSHLVQGLQCLTDLEQLDLSHNNISSDGAASLACAFRYLTKLSILQLSHNNISSDGAASLACAVRYLTKLYYLCLSQNNIGSDGMIALVHGLSCLTKLRHLNISLYNVDSKVKKTVRTSLKGVSII